VRDMTAKPAMLTPLKSSCSPLPTNLLTDSK
jgi:hypothetical protein